MLRAFFNCERARQSPSRPLELEPLPSPSMHVRTIVSDRLVHSNALIVTEDLTNKVVAWAIEIARACSARAKWQDFSRRSG